MKRTYSIRCATACSGAAGAGSAVPFIQGLKMYDCNWDTISSKLLPQFTAEQLRQFSRRCHYDLLID